MLDEVKSKVVVCESKIEILGIETQNECRLVKIANSCSFLPPCVKGDQSVEGYHVASKI